MFSKQIRLTGIHAKILKKYSPSKQAEIQDPYIVKDQGENKTIYLFSTMLQCYMCSAMIGIINDRKSSADNDGYAATIFADILNSNRTTLDKILRFLILHENMNESADKAIKETFKIELTPEEKSSYQELLDSYARGGLEILDEKFGDLDTLEQVSNEIIDLLEEYAIE